MIVTSLQSISNFSSLPAPFVHALVSKETLLDIDTVYIIIRKLLRIFIQHPPLRLGNVNMTILRTFYGS